VSERPESGCVYEIRHYRWLVYLPVATLTAVALAGIVRFGSQGLVAWVPVGLFVILTAAIVYTQQWQPYRVVITPGGVRMTWTLGVRNVLWEDIEAIELPPHRFEPGQVAEVDIRLKRGGKVELVSSLTNFDDLVRRLRELHPELIRE
jgi:hypothetical protein